jgi:hypothetical protein
MQALETGAAQQLPPGAVPPTQAAVAEPLPTLPGTPAGTVVPPLASTVAVAAEASPVPATNNEARWRNEQLDRQLFPQLTSYFTNSAELYWYDPVNQQHVLLGTIGGVFQAQAQFKLVDNGADALEIPYEVNKSFGLTALSPALVTRIMVAGYSDWIETYVILTPEMVPL